ncbi:MAG: ribosome-associated translation inhibitor RaiA [Paludibacteraceae bacterium]|nr:ribosome-associated translation inhibitor RaiA [Paludibacteraceae bacterium]
MKLTINAVNFEIAEHLEKYIDKKTHRYERLLNNEGAAMSLRLTVVKPETNLNKQTQIRITGNGPEMFAEKTCDTFEQGIDLCLEALDKQIERLKERG